jgi:DNA phosphorothioation-dependent restriction protein DptH
VANVAPVAAPPEPPAVEEPPPAPSAEPKVAPAVPYDIMLGVTGDSPQYGLLGDVSGRRVAIDLNQTHTISLFGVQGGGKSYTLGTIAEMASLPIPNINVLPQPLATVIFHYSPTMDYRPEFTSMVAPNSEAAQVKALKETFGAEPQALSDVLLLAPADKLEERKLEYPGIEVRPLKFGAAELQTSHWRFLMGAVGNQATYIRQLNRVMKLLRDDLTLEGLNQGIEASSLPDHLKGMAKMRLELASEYIDDSIRLKDEIRPGRLIIVDLRDEFIEKDEALGLFVVLLQLFADAKYRDAQGAEHSFNKLVVFDEAHKYIESPDLVAGLIEVVREMRHKGTSIMVASQDPPSVPVSLIELSSQVILHKFNSPAWLKHIQKANAALGSLTPEKMSSLRPGEAFIWSSKATDEAFTKSAVKIRCRPRVTHHGGATKTAVS